MYLAPPAGSDPPYAWRESAVLGGIRRPGGWCRFARARSGGV